MLAVMSLLGFGLAFGSAYEVAFPLQSKGPSIHLSDGRIFRTTWHPDATPVTVEAFMAAVPFQSFLFHTVSSGRNLALLMPTQGDRFKMRSKLEEGVQARSACRAGTLFLRHDQMVVLTYVSSRDHESYMPPILTVDEEDLPALQAFGKEVWEEQLRGESKEPFTLAFSSVGPLAAWGPLFKDQLTGNQVVDDAVAVIRSQTTHHWLVPPKEVALLMTTGDALGLEGTEGYIFPPMVIATGVMMVLSSYAHSGTVNSIATLFEDGLANGDLNSIKRFVRKIGETNLPYLRSLSLHMICDCFDKFFAALKEAQTVSEVGPLFHAMSTLGALVHGWMVFLFPYRLGLGLHRQAASADILKVEPPSHASFCVPLRSREGEGLGVATWNVGSPEDREKVSTNAHLPGNLQTGDLPLIVRLQPSATSISLANLAVRARARIEEHLPTRGAILFRGLSLSTFSEASDFIAALGYTMYPDPSGREKVAKMLWHSSLGMKPDFNIAPHQEHIVSKNPPSKLFLYCQTPSLEGGETPLAHAGDVWDSLPNNIRDQLRSRGVRFEMLRGNAAEPSNPVKFTRSWQEHFSTDELQTALAKASEQFDGTVSVDENGNIFLRSELLQVVQMEQGREIYRSQLQNIHSLKWLWGDSDEYISDEILEHIMSSVWSASTTFEWQACGIRRRFPSFPTVCLETNMNSNQSSDASQCQSKVG